MLRFPSGAARPGQRRWRGRLVTLLALVSCLAIGAVAAAAGDDRAAAEGMLKEVEASPRKDVAGELVARSRAALERAAQLRAAGDEGHARIADSLARTWAEAARDVARAAVVEESAATLRRFATDAGVLADRERAQLEEAIAQSGRLRAQMEALEKGAKEQPARTSAAANADGGVRPPAKASPAAKDAGVLAPPKAGADGGAR